MLYQSSVPLRGLGVVGDAVYFGVSTLVGEIRRCPVSGCVHNPDVLASSERWPSWLQVDEHAAYWLNSNPRSLLGATLMTTSSDGSNAPRTLANLVLFSGWSLTMNSHHLYWLDRYFDVALTLNTLAK